MNKILILVFVLCAPFAQAQDPDPYFNDKAAFSEGLNYRKSAAFKESDDYSSFNLLYQRLEFSLDPAVNYISGSVFSTLKFLKDSVSQVRFDLVSSMTVDSVLYQQKKIVFQHSSDKIILTLPTEQHKNSLISFAIYYHGAPPQTGFGSFTVAKHNDVPVLWTLSEPYGAKDWWPCKESLADKIDSLDVFITCPDQYKAASNGKLISDQVMNGKRTAHWKHRYPIATYLVGIAVTNYESYSDFLDLDDGKRIEVLNYIYPEYLSTAKTKSAEILDILSFYNSKFITYPFADEKYGHAQFSWGGGMEHQTMSFMTHLNFELVAHEMAHQWFGDYITLASWHDIWLNEGFATYLTGLTYEKLFGGVYWNNWKSYQVKSITSSTSGSVYVADTTNVGQIFNGRLSYSKGAYLLHMLRWEMGDELFFKGLNNYLNDPALANGFASQEKFVSHMESVADTSFTEFFKDWYYGEGYPVFKLNYYTDFGDFGKQKLRISQSSSHPSVEFFEMHIPVRVWKGGNYVDLRLYYTRQNQEFVISSGRIDSVEFDPEKWLIAKADQVLKVQEIKNPNQMRIIPDYNGKRIRVILPDFTGKEKLCIVDINGRIIKTIFLLTRDSWIDIHELKTGVYLINIQSKDQNKTIKIRISK